MRQAILFVLVAACSGGSSSREPQPPEPPPREQRPEPPGRLVSWSVPWSDRDLLAIAVAPSGDILTTDGTTLRVHDGATGKVTRSADGCYPKRGTFRFAASDRLVIACREGFVYLSWPALVRTEGPKDEIQAAAVGPAAVAAAVGEMSTARRVRVWGYDGRLVHWFDARDGVRALAFSPDGAWLAAASGAGVEIHDLRSRRLVTVHGKDDTVGSIAFSPDGERVFLASFRPFELRTKDGGALRTFSFLGGGSPDVAYIDEDTLVLATRDKIVRILADGSEEPIDLGVKGPFVLAPNGRAVCRADDGKLDCFVLPLGRAPAPPPAVALPTKPPPPEPALLDARPPPPTAPSGYDLAWKADTGAFWLFIPPPGDTLLAIERHGQIRFHSLADGKVSRTGSVCVGNDGNIGFTAADRFASVCEDHVEIWTFPALAQDASHKLAEDMNTAAAAAGRVAVDVEDKPHIRVFDSASWKTVDDFDTDAVLNEDSMAFSADGKRLVFSTHGGLQIRTLATHKTARLLESQAVALAFSPDGKRVFANTGGTSTLELDADSGGQLHGWRGLLLRTASYASADLVVANGIDGLQLFSGSGPDDPPTLAGYDRASTSLNDGAIVCAAGDAVTACFRRSR
jgi:WD40 repeat protein